MLLHRIISVLGFYSTVCFGHETTFDTEMMEGKRGAVFKWAPTQKVKLQLVHFEKKEQLLKDDVTKFQVATKDTKYEGRIICHRIKINADKPTEITQLRVSVVVEGHSFKAEETTLDEFVVTSCDKDTLDTLFVVTSTGTNKYTITFKDTNKRCLTRQIEVKPDELSLIVVRGEPETKNCKQISSAFQTRSGVVVPNLWADNGELLDYDLKHINEASTKTYDLQGNNGRFEHTFVACQPVTKDGKMIMAVDVFFTGFTIDRLFANSCSQLTLKNSIVMDQVTGSRQKHIYIDYLDTNGKCNRRQYTVDKEVVQGDNFMVRVDLERYKFYPSNCYKQKLLGVARAVAHKTGVRRFYKTFIDK